MISPVIVAVVLAAAILALGLLVMRNRRSDNIDSFRRQIDALSPEARRPVVDQVNRLEPDLDLNPTPIIDRVSDEASGDDGADDVARSAGRDDDHHDTVDHDLDQDDDQHHDDDEQEGDGNGT